MISSGQDGQLKFWEISTNKCYDKIKFKQSISTLNKFQDKNTDFLGLGTDDGLLIILQNVSRKWQQFQSFKVTFLIFLGLRYLTPPLQKLSFLTNREDFCEFKCVNIISGAEISVGTNQEEDQPLFLNDSHINVVESTLKINLTLTLAGGKKNGLLCFWTSENSRDWKREYQFKAHNKSIIKIAKFNDYLITCAQYESEIKFWDFNKYQLCYLIKEQQYVCSLQLDSIQGILWVGTYEKNSGKGKINLWNASSHAQIQEIGNYSSKAIKIVIQNKIIGATFSSNDLIVFQK